MPLSTLMKIPDQFVAENYKKKRFLLLFEKHKTAIVKGETITLNLIAFTLTFSNFSRNFFLAKLNYELSFLLPADENVLYMLM